MLIILSLIIINNYSKISYSDRKDMQRVGMTEDEMEANQSSRQSLKGTSEGEEEEGILR